MQNRLDEDGNTFSFETLDIRSIDAAVLITSKNPADLALAILAGGGDDLLPEILKRAAELKGAARSGVGSNHSAGRVAWSLNAGRIEDRGNGYGH